MTASQLIAAVDLLSLDVKFKPSEDFNIIGIQKENSATRRLPYLEHLF